MARTLKAGFITATILAVATLIAGPAAAHTGGGAAGGFGAGFVHPFLGLDHLLAMTAVGLWAARLGGSARIAVPAAFVGVMALGGVIGAAGVALPLVEPAIAVSVIAMGVLLMGGIRMPVAAGMALVGVFAVFHGHAHGSEIPAAASAPIYALGFAGATALLHGIGLAVGLGTLRNRPLLGFRLLRVAGSGIAAAGLFLLVM